jgi:hypothetical protein
MSECLPDIPAGSTVRQNTDGSWWYLPQLGPWLPMPAPQGTAPWADGPAVPESREPASVAADPTLADRLALAVCRGACPTGGPCPVEAICSDCRRDSAAVAHELAAILRERHGGSFQVADWLDGVGCYTPGAGQTAQEGS